jgi:hypothetical protein
VLAVHVERQLLLGMLVPLLSLLPRLPQLSLLPRLLLLLLCHVKTHQVPLYWLEHCVLCCHLQAHDQSHNHVSRLVATSSCQTPQSTTSKTTMHAETVQTKCMLSNL